MKKSLVLVVIFPLLLLSYGIYECTKKPGFRIHKIALADSNEWTTLQPPLDPSIFSQNYHYLKGGTQSYAFESEDKKYVLKFFKKNHITPQNWLKYLPMSKNWCQRKIDKHIENRNQLFSSHKICFEKFKDETGLIYVHLTPTSHLNTSLCLMDRQGKKDHIDLNTTIFVVQKKAVLLSEKIAECKSDEEFDQICMQIKNLVRKRCQLGLRDLDGKLDFNYGFIDDAPIQFDIGQVVYDPSIDIDKELAHVDAKLKDFKRDFK